MDWGGRAVILQSRKTRAKAWMQGIKINIFDRQSIKPAIRPVLTAAAFGLADALPVGGPATTAGKAVAVDKSFPQMDGAAVVSLPVAAQTPGDAAQRMAGQIAPPHPGADPDTSIR